MSGGAPTRTADGARWRRVRYPRIDGHRTPTGRPGARRIGSRARHRGRRRAARIARGTGRAGQRALPRRGRAGALRRRVRPALPRAGRARDRAPGAHHARLADPACRRVLRRHVRRGPPRPADAVARQCLQPRGAARLRRSRPQGPRPARRARAGSGADVRRRAQDRRPRHQPPLRARPVRPGRHPRRRHDRRGRDREPAHDLGHPLPAGRARDARRARRGLHAEGRVQADQRGARGGRPRPVCQPAQQRRRLAPPDRPGGDRQPHGCRRGTTSSSRTGRPSRASRRRSSASRPSASRSTRNGDRASTSRPSSPSPSAGARPATTSRTRPTASSSRSTATTSRRASGW